MGAWGYKALDSDQALDWLGNHVTDQIGMEISKLLDSFEQSEHPKRVNIAFEVRAAAYVLEKLNFFRHELNLHERMVLALKRIMSDPEWLALWDNPQAVHKEIDLQIRALEDGPRGTTLMENLGQ